MAEAITNWHKVLSLSPGSSYTLSTWGDALWDEQDPREALPQYRKALQLIPWNSSIRRGLANTLWELNRLEEAYAEFQQATRRFPGYIEALADWGGALASEGLLPDAIFKWEAALRINPRSFYVYKVYKGWGNALFDQEEYALAIAKYQKALEFSPADVAIRKNLERAEEELSKSRPRQVTNHQVDYCRDNDPFTGLRQQRSRACLLSRKDRLELDHG